MDSKLKLTAYLERTQSPLTKFHDPQGRCFDSRAELKWSYSVNVYYV